MLRKGNHIKVEAVLIFLAAFIGLNIYFIVSDARESIRKWWYNVPSASVEEVDESDTLDIDIENIGPQQSAEKELMIRHLNEHMAEFLNVYDVE